MFEPVERVPLKDQGLTREDLEDFRSMQKEIDCLVLDRLGEVANNV